MEKLAEEIPRLRGREREEAMERYRRLLLSSKKRPIYLRRSG